MSRKHFPTVILVLVLLIGVALLYLPGVGSAFYYDDYSNLKGLSHINDWASFLEFIRAGHAGPLGRPISLLTFAAQKSAWPGDGVSLFAVNISIHACNAALLFLVARKIYLMTASHAQKANEFAFLVAAFWACSPILASSSLILIQRMTTLAGFFTLLTLLIYLKGFDLFVEKPNKRLIFQAIFLALGTVFAVLSKENGALLPTLVFVLESTLLRKSASAEKFRKIRLGILGSSLLVFLVYLSPLARSWFEVSEFRGFSSWERLKGEFFILWRYIFLAIAPKVAYFGPFQDQNILVQDSIKIFFSGLGLLGLLIFAFILRKKNSWPLFAILWFFVGHLLESTTLLLEPYYEHRNYIPLVGLAILFAHLVVSLGSKYGYFIKITAYGYLAINAVILFMVSSLWGKPLEAAEFWVETNPGSIRAVAHQVNLTMASSSEEVAKNNEETLKVSKIVGAMQMLDKASNWCQDCLSVYLQALTYSCIVEGPEEKKRRLSVIYSILDEGRIRIDVTSVDATSVISKLIFSNQCAGIDYAEVNMLLEKMIEVNKKFTDSNLRSKIFYQKATLAYAEERYDDAEIFIKKADEAWPSAEPVIGYQVDFYLQQGMPAKAAELIERKLSQQEKREISLSAAYTESLKKILDEISNENQHSPSSKK